MEIIRVLPKNNKEAKFDLPVLREGLYILGISQSELTKEDITKLINESTLEEGLYYYDGKLTTKLEKLKEQLIKDYRTVKYTIEKLPIQK